MEYIVIDLEFNQPFDFPTGRKTVLVPECPFEIMQIGAVKLNSQMEIIDCKDFLIKPTVYKRIHPYVKKMTGIGLTQLSKHSQFAEVYKEFLEFAGGEDNILCVWGSHDIRALFNNIKYHGLDYAMLTKKFIDVQQLATNKLEKSQGTTVGLKNAAELFGIEIVESFHNALNDARYTAKVFQLVDFSDANILTYSEPKEQAPKNYSIDIPQLYKAAEKEFGRKLTKKERWLVQKVYFMGRTKQFDTKPPKK